MTACMSLSRSAVTAGPMGQMIDGSKTRKLAHLLFEIHREKRDLGGSTNGLRKAGTGLFKLSVMPSRDT
jgi:hypothetical protein